MSRKNERTLGDGMESMPTLTNLFCEKNRNPTLGKLNIKSMDKTLKTHKADVPLGKVIPIVPKYVPSMKKPKYLLQKPKEPKFVPYEPYKCAMEPIVQKKPEVKVLTKRDKNNVDIQDLVTQMSHMRMQMMEKAKVEAIVTNEPLITKSEWEKEKQAYETDIKNLKETNAHLENQLKFQVQVNSELKTLLVAAVGEDLETRVQHLTQDKLQLARALLNSANHLTSHQEQTEWLSGQCEVWRSKFLASSLMVEELARWKFALSIRINDLQESIKNLLEERNKVRSNNLNTFSNLMELNEKHGGIDNIPIVKTSHILELSNLNNILSANLLAKLLNNQNNKECYMTLADLPNLTRAEAMAAKLLEDHIVLGNKPDSICNAVMEAAILTHGQKHLQHSQATCAHCKGEMEQI